MYHIEKTWHFHYAHRNHLLGPGDKCARIHGHTAYVVGVFEFPEPKENGVTMLFTDIDDVCERIVKDFDHWLLVWKDDPVQKALASAGLDHYVMDFPTTAENFARYFYEEFERQGLPVVEVGFKETPSSMVRYRPTVTHTLD